MTYDDNTGARARAIARALLAFVVFPNLLFVLFGTFFYTHRELINIDYALLGAAWLWLPMWLRVTAYAVLCVIDGISSTAAMYNINPLAGVVALFDAPPGLIVTVLLGFAVVVGFAVGIGRFTARFLRDRQRRWLIGAALLAIVLVTTDYASSATVRFAADMRDRVRSASAETYPVAAASDSIRAAVESGSVAAANIVLVMVESMGVLRDSALRAYTWQPIENAAVRARYNVVAGDVAFRGGTTSGELRELCGIFADYITLPREVLPRCLPRRLATRGFTTFAVHGYKDTYYNRARWYPMLFDSIYFEDRLDANTGDVRCGTQFRGICDRDAFVTVERLARGGRNRLVYWMTLDAHTPVDMARREEFSADWQGPALQIPVCTVVAEACMQAIFWRHMFARLAGLALDAQLPPTRFLIVGDHAPAYVRRDRAGAFVPGRVPYIELVPKL